MNKYITFDMASLLTRASPGQTSFLRALDARTPTYIFPAMNTHMYTHPLTAKHLKIVAEDIGYEVVGPIGKELACGDIGGSLSKVSVVVSMSLFLIS